MKAIDTRHFPSNPKTNFATFNELCLAAFNETRPDMDKAVQLANAYLINKYKVPTGYFLSALKMVVNAERETFNDDLLRDI